MIAAAAAVPSARVTTDVVAQLAAVPASLPFAQAAAVIHDAPPGTLAAWLSTSKYFPSLKTVEYFAAVCAVVTMIAGVSLYVSERGDRVLNRQMQAWQLISAAQGKPGDLGRTESLQYLNRTGADLTRAPASQAALQEISLEFARLIGAQFDSSILEGAKLRGANLMASSFVGANLQGADLAGVCAEGAKFDQANLRYVNLTNALLGQSSMSRVRFSSAKLDSVDLNFSDLHRSWFHLSSVKGARFTYADLRNSDWQQTEWREIAYLRGANVYGVNDSSFLRWAVDSMGAVAISGDSAWKAYRPPPTLHSARLAHIDCLRFHDR